MLCSPFSKGPEKPGKSPFLCSREERVIQKTQKGQQAEWLQRNWMWKSQRNILGVVCDPLRMVLLRVETALVLGCCRDLGTRRSSESLRRSAAPAAVMVYTFDHCQTP